MKKIIAAVISTVGAVIWGATVLYLLINSISGNSENSMNGPAIIVVEVFFLIFSISTVLYTKWTGFGRHLDSRIEKVDMEILLLQKQLKRANLEKQRNG